MIARGAGTGKMIGGRVVKKEKFSASTNKKDTEFTVNISV
jgi:hypothetical protein